MRSRIAGLLSVVILTGPATATPQPHRNDPRWTSTRCTRSCPMTRRRPPRRRTHRSSTAGGSASARPRRGGRRTTARTPRRSTAARARRPRLTVAVPGGPTGTVFNASSTDFVVSQGGKSGSRPLPVRDGSRDDPRLVADRCSATSAVIGVDRSSSGAVYKGLAVAERPVVRNRLPQRPRRCVQRIVRAAPALGGCLQGSQHSDALRAVRHPGTAGDMIFVTYAKQDADAEDEIAGRHLGPPTSMRSLPTDGTFIARVASAWAL